MRTTMSTLSVLERRMVDRISGLNNAKCVHNFLSPNFVVNYNTVYLLMLFPDSDILKYSQIYFIGPKY
jgi:hypothetical protein